MAWSPPARQRRYWLFEQAGDYATLKFQPLPRRHPLAETRILTETTMFDIRVSEIAAPAEGDTIEVHGTVYVIQSEPIRDAERLIWTIEARPA